MLDVLRLLIHCTNSSFHLHAVHFSQHSELNIPSRYNQVNVLMLSEWGKWLKMLGREQREAQEHEHS